MKRKFTGEVLEWLDQPTGNKSWSLYSWYGPTPPANANPGDYWFRTYDEAIDGPGSGVASAVGLYTYYYDGTSSEWIEITFSREGENDGKFLGFSSKADLEDYGSVENGTISRVIHNGTSVYYVADSNAAHQGLPPGWKPFGMVSLDHFESIADADAFSDATGTPIYVPTGTSLTGSSPTESSARYYGDDHLVLGGQKRGRDFALIGKQHTFPTATTARNQFNGDASKSAHQIDVEMTDSGGNPFGPVGANYVYAPHYTPSFINMMVNSGVGWNQSTDRNGPGRTGITANRARIAHYGEGDAACFNGSVYVAGAMPGATHYLANPAGVLFNGDLSAGTDGVYLNAGEMRLMDNGHDVSGIGWVLNLVRDNSLGGLSAGWEGVRIQSQGSEEVDSGFRADGKIKVGVNLSRMTSASEAALAIKTGHRMYLGSTAGGDFGTILGNTYLTFNGADVVTQVGGNASWAVGVTENVSGANLRISGHKLRLDNTTAAVGASELYQTDSGFLFHVQDGSEIWRSGADSFQFKTRVSIEPDSLLLYGGNNGTTFTQYISASKRLLTKVDNTTVSEQTPTQTTIPTDLKVHDSSLFLSAQGFNGNALEMFQSGTGGLTVSLNAASLFDVDSNGLAAANDMSVPAGKRVLLDGADGDTYLTNSGNTAQVYLGGNLRAQISDTQLEYHGNIWIGSGNLILDNENYTGVNASLRQKDTGDVAITTGGQTLLNLGLAGSDSVLAAEDGAKLTLDSTLVIDVDTDNANGVIIRSAQSNADLYLGQGATSNGIAVWADTAVVEARGGSESLAIGPTNAGDLIFYTGSGRGERFRMYSTGEWVFRNAGSIEGNHLTVGGEAGGPVSLTVNDGGGNANIAFNHRGNVAQGGTETAPGSGISDMSSARIVSDVDSPDARIGFMLYDNAIAGQTGAGVQVLSMNTTDAHFSVPLRSPSINNRITLDKAAEDPRILFTNSDYVGGPGMVLYTADGAMQFHTNGGGRAYLTDVGFLGLGRSDPQTKLHVYDSSVSSTLRLENAGVAVDLAAEGDSMVYKAAQSGTPLGTAKHVFKIAGTVVATLGEAETFFLANIRMTDTELLFSNSTYLATGGGAGAARLTQEDDGKLSFNINSNYRAGLSKDGDFDVLGDVTAARMGLGVTPTSHVLETAGSALIGGDFKVSSSFPNFTVESTNINSSPDLTITGRTAGDVSFIAGRMETNSLGRVNIHADPNGTGSGGDVDITSGGNFLARFHRNGDVGLGTSIPAARIHAASNDPTTGLGLENSTQYSRIGAEINNLVYRVDMNGGGVDPAHVFMIGSNHIALMDNDGLYLGGQARPDSMLHIHEDAGVSLTMTTSTQKSSVGVEANNMVYRADDDDQLAGVKPAHAFFSKNGLLGWLDEDGLGVGTSNITADLDVNGGRMRLRQSNPPSSSTDAGQPGEIAWDNQYLYLCYGVNQWKRIALDGTPW